MVTSEVDRVVVILCIKRVVNMTYYTFDVYPTYTFKCTTRHEFLFFSPSKDITIEDRRLRDPRPEKARTPCLDVF